MSECPPVIDGQLADSEEGFLHRWSRRKHGLADREQQGQKTSESETTLAEVETSVDESQPPVLTDADMPPLESLDEHSDYSGFLSSGVSEQLRNLALRKLFHLPGFNLTDGLEVYDDDYTYFAKLGDIITCDMKHMMEVEARKQAERLAAEAEQEQQMMTVESEESAQVIEAGEEAQVDVQTEFEEVLQCVEGDEEDMAF